MTVSNWPTQLEKKLEIFIDQINKKINTFFVKQVPKSTRPNQQK